MKTKKIKIHQFEKVKLATQQQVKIKGGYGPGIEPGVAKIAVIFYSNGTCLPMGRHVLCGYGFN